MEADLPLCTYESAGGVVVASTGDLVLVLARAKRLGPNERPEVRLPKGHIETGEDSAQAALREVREESGLANLEILADLDWQRVSFAWNDTRYVRNERYFLMAVRSYTEHGQPEAQFERLWLPWADALAQLTFESEQEWARRAQAAWIRLQYVSDQDAEQTDDHAQVEKKVSIGD